MIDFKVKYLVKCLNRELRKDNIVLSHGRCLEIVNKLFDFQNQNQQYDDLMDFNSKPVVLTSHELGYYEKRKFGK